MVRTEKHLYKHIKHWLGHNGYVVDKNWENTGPGKLRVDVTGVRSCGTKYCDDIEIVAVEAKLWGNYQTLGQAENYKDFAHKVYFATASKYVADKHRDGCAEKNLGLLYVNKRTGRIAEVLSAPVGRPKSDAKMVEFLRKLWIARCPLCKCYFNLWDKWNKKAWLRRPVEFTRGSKEVSFYLCPECFKMLRDPVEERVDKTERWCDWLEKRQDKKAENFDNKYGGKVDWIWEDYNRKVERLDKKYGEKIDWIWSDYNRKVGQLKKRYDDWCKDLDRYYYKEVKKLKKR